MVIKIFNGRIITDIVEENKSLYIKNGSIMAITCENLPFDKEIDAQGGYVSAGFIDIHSHGGGGYDFMDGGVEPIINGSKLHLKHGTTSIMPTTTASSIGILKQAIEDIGTAMQSSEVNILGAHLEGPYFSLNQCGAQNPRYIKKPEKREYEELLKNGEGVIKRWSFAPELDGALEFCNTLIRNDIIPSIAHSDAVYEDVEKIYKAGCSLITHLYSGMSGIIRRQGYRLLGVIESAYIIDNMNVEVIADGKHLPPELLRLIYKFKGAEKICLVTDSMRAAGMPEGPSLLGRKDEGMECIIEDGVAKLPDRTAFAGSVATMDKLVLTMHRQAGVDIVNSVKMVTENPAKILGLDKKGILEEGFDADIVIFDENINIKYIVIKEKESWKSEQVKIHRN